MLKSPKANRWPNHTWDHPGQLRQGDCRAAWWWHTNTIPILLQYHTNTLKPNGQLYRVPDKIAPQWTIVTPPLCLWSCGSCNIPNSVDRSGRDLHFPSHPASQMSIMHTKSVSSSKIKSWTKQFYYSLTEHSGAATSDREDHCQECQGLGECGKDQK